MEPVRAELLPERSLGACFREREVVFLILLVVGTYFTRLDALPIRGEESRRGVVALEMQRNGDWIVPRYQGNPFFMSSRPPLQAWSIAACGWLRGGIDTVAVRIPSVVALLALVLVIYVCARSFLSRLGAFAAAAAYPTMGSVLQLGRLGETDLLFTLFVSSSLLVWYAGYLRKWPAAGVWGAAYLLVALGVLTKGPQAPAYFAASIGLYLFWVRNLRFLASWGHALGIVVFAATLGAWQLPYFLAVGVRGTRHVYLGDVAMYGHVHTWRHLAEHIVAYPVEILIGCLLPWSFLLLAYCRRNFRTQLGSMSDAVTFLTCSIVATFPSVWLVADARSRFYMPLFPCFALLSAIVVEKRFAADDERLRRFWAMFVALMAAVTAASGVFLLGASLAGEAPFDLPTGSALMFCLFAVACAAIMFVVRGGRTRREGAIAIATMAGFIGTAFATVTTDAMRRNAIDKETQMARLLERLPDDVRLYSFGAVNHAFAFYHGGDIGHVHFPPDAIYPDDFEYFCFNLVDFPQQDSLPFPWEILGVVSSGRNRDHELQTLVVVGRRVEAGDRPTPDAIVASYRTMHESGAHVSESLADRGELLRRR